MNTTDYDGDEFNNTILLDNKMASLFEVFSPYNTLTNVSKPFSLASTFTLLSPANNLLTNYISDKTEHPETDTVSHLLASE